MLQLSGVLYCNAELSDPWGIEIPQIDSVMNVEVIMSGQCWLEIDDSEPVFLPEGSLVLIPGGNRHRLRSKPGAKTTPLQKIPIERIGERFEKMHFGGGGRVTKITYYGMRYDSYLAARLIRLLPPMLHLRTHADDNSWLHSTINFISQEATLNQPGSENVITRLADVLVIQAIRTWIDSVRAEPEGWIPALYDRQIGAALSLLHRHPERDWRVESLAREIGMSRSGLSARFTEMVGESVVHYLTDLRIQIAHRELRETPDTLAQIAERVGYQSEPAFSRAFKRVVGVSPGSVRRGSSNPKGAA